jgi:hypothetical protein
MEHWTGLNFGFVLMATVKGCNHGYCPKTNFHQLTVWVVIPGAAQKCDGSFSRSPSSKHLLKSTRGSLELQMLLHLSLVVQRTTHKAHRKPLALHLSSPMATRAATIA